jgi:hypothetical protein
MLEAASRREFDPPLLCSLDRFSREGILNTMTSLKRLVDYGVKYHQRVPGSDSGEFELVLVSHQRPPSRRPKLADPRNSRFIPFPTGSRMQQPIDGTLPPTNSSRT